MDSSRSARRLACGLTTSLIHAATILGLVFGEYGYAVAATSENADDTTPPSAGLSDADLEELVGPIALYPDELLAITLPASTYPIQIVQAARFLDKHEKDPDLKPEEDWDESVLGLLNYPEVINLMNEDLDWTWKLGEAVANQQDDVMYAVQTFRGRADEAGNLETNDKVTVSKEEKEDQQVIIIESASPEVIYVPQYQPSTVVVYQSAPYPYYYSRPYPYYYRPAAVFWTGLFVGAAVGYGMRWGWGRGNNSVNVNRNVNVNVDRPTRPSGPSGGGDRPGGGNRPSQGGGEKWKPEKGGGNQAGGRPGQGAGGDRPSAGTRPSTGGERPGSGGQRPSTGSRESRPSTGSRESRPSTGSRDSKPSTGSRESRPSTGTRDPSSSSRSRDSASRPSTGSSGRDLTSSRSSRSSSMGSYGGGSSTRSHSSRGSSSRGSMSRGGGSRGGGGRRR